MCTPLQVSWLPLLSHLEPPVDFHGELLPTTPTAQRLVRRLGQRRAAPPHRHALARLTEAAHMWAPLVF